ncbi:hypothetical protein E2C01_096356 [Portunus trituberculatus]|uniref:Uncharacterized protein n=1 Tax=Portunus trituberculatus TaxID=210409 RepID=A0A5B7JXR1_PORTR|nr:hypothetical protein [Portunus trituberculatus]
MGSRHALPCLVVLLLAAWGHCSISVINEIIPTEGDEVSGVLDTAMFVLEEEEEKKEEEEEEYKGRTNIN